MKIRILVALALLLTFGCGRIPAAHVATAAATLGSMATTGGGWDTGGDSNDLDGTKVVAPAGGATVTALSAYVGPVDPNDRRYGLAIYADNGGVPGSLIASATGTLAGQGWNSLPLTATLASNAAYWLVYNTGSNDYHNDLYVVPGPGNAGGWSSPVACCAFPDPAPAWTLYGNQYSIYATLSTSGPPPAPTATSTSTATGTATRAPTQTNSPAPTGTAILTNTPTVTVTGTVPATHTPTATGTPTATATSTVAPAPTSTRTGTPVAASPTPSSTPTRRLVFDDEFNGTSLDTTVWVPMQRGGDASNSEQQCYLRSNATVTGGSLVLTDRQDSSCSGYSYTSAMVQTGAYNFTYGTFEVRAQMPKGQGQWPALWLLGANCQVNNISTPDNVGSCQWPTPGSNEIDLFEGKGQSPTLGFFNLNTGTSPNSDNQAFGCNGVGLPFDTSAGYHTYDLIWQAGSLAWQIDGVTYCSTTANVPSTPMFILLNVAMGGSFTGSSIDTSVLPQSLRIDYVRIYQ